MKKLHSKQSRGEYITTEKFLKKLCKKWQRGVHFHDLTITEIPFIVVVDGRLRVKAFVEFLHVWPFRAEL